MDNTFEALHTWDGKESGCHYPDKRIVRIGFPLSISAYSNNKL